MTNWTLDKDDCRTWLPTIEDGSIDLVLIDPPYVISRPTGFDRGGSSDFNHLHADFGAWDHGDAGLLSAIMPDIHRTLRQGGTFICWYDLWKLTPLSDTIKDAGFKQLRFIEWIKSNPAPINSGINYLTNAREIAVSAIKGKRPTFNSKHDKGIYEMATEQRGPHRFHPTPKPVSLLRHLIRKHSNPGDTILDCFSGSGTTAHAAILEGRRFVGCEIDPIYHEKSKALLQGIRSPDTLQLDIPADG